MGMFSEVASTATVYAIVDKIYSRWMTATDPVAKAAYAQAILDCEEGFEWSTPPAYRAIADKVRSSIPPAP